MPHIHVALDKQRTCVSNDTSLATVIKCHTTSLGMLHTFIHSFGNLYTFSISSPFVCPLEIAAVRGLYLWNEWTHHNFLCIIYHQKNSFTQKINRLFPKEINPNSIIISSSISSSTFSGTIGIGKQQYFVDLFNAWDPQQRTNLKKSYKIAIFFF